MKNTYEDIINLPHHVSTKHPQMTRTARAAQFAPFAALTGYSDAIKETSRLTSKRIELDEELKIILNNKLQLILDNINETPEVSFTYFIYDNIKSGGEYITITGIVKKIDIVNGYIFLTDKTKIPINEIININSNIFNKYEE
mgnify:CR=1 FL=1